MHPTVAGVMMGLLFASYLPSEERLERIPVMGRNFLSAPTAERAREVVRSVSRSLPVNDRLSLRLHPLVSIAVTIALAYRGSLCYPEDVRAELPPLAQIPDLD